MHKLLVGVHFIFLGFLLLSCGSSASSTNLLDNSTSPPIIVLARSADTKEKEAALLLSDAFKNSSGLSIPIVNESSKSQTSGIKMYIGRTTRNLKSKHINSLQHDGYCIEYNADNIAIYGKTTTGTNNGVIAFIKNHLGTTYVSPGEIYYEKKSEITIKKNSVIISNPAFEYREAFFPSAMQADFTKWNMSHHLENEWLIWGHNLPKFLKDCKLPNEAYALVNGRRAYEQFCFSNKSLLTEVIKEINKKLQAGYTGQRVAIWPNDNALVCTCKDCTALGNTTTNGSPSVNHFIAELANEFKQLQFFTSSYLSTAQPSVQKLPSNTGVFISTINYPKNTPLANSKYRSEFEQNLKRWKSAVSKVYIWDYAVNYTLYSDFFPTLKAMQEDLKYFNRLGVNGVFVQGSDYDYSVFEDIKSYTITGLLWNPYLNLDSLRYSYIEKAYPKHVEFINDYLVQLESSAFTKKSPLSVYAGVSQATSTYLEPSDFELFYYGLSEKIKEASSKEQGRLLKAYTLLTHLKLELMRSFGIREFGYADISKGYKYTPKKEANLLRNCLDSISQRTRIHILNEQKLTVAAYLNYCKQYLETQAVNLFYHGKYSIKSPVDEGYEQKASYILSDGAFGLPDYETNWLLSTNKPLEIVIQTTMLKKASEVSFNFLADARHAIYTPARIEIYELPTNKLLTLYSKKTPDENTAIRNISLNIDLNNSRDILIKMIPDNSPNPNKTAIACDEVQFR